MKTFFILPSLAAVLIVSCSRKTSPADSSPGSKATASSVSAEKAASYFEKSCSGCHGNGASYSKGPDLTKITVSRDHVVHAITNGEGYSMPSFKGDYSKAEIEALADYVMSLRK